MESALQESTIQGNNLPDEIENSLKKLETNLNNQFPLGIPRKEIGRATGNILHPRTCRNEDSLGTGIPERFKAGRHIVYPVPSVIKRLRSKISVAA